MSTTKKKSKKLAATVKKPRAKPVKVEGQRGRPSELHGKKIHLLATENPRRKGTAGHKSFALIKNGMLVEDFVAAGGRMKDLNWDLERKYVEVK